MNASPRIVRLLSAMLVASRVFVATAHAQSATITVAPIAPVLAGNAISVSFTITNTGTSSRLFGIRAEIRQGATMLADLGTRGTSMVAPGATASGAYSFIVPTGWSSGTYTARAEVWTGTPGSTTLLNSYDRDFAVQEQLTSATITVAPIATVLAGNSISVSYTVTNTGNYSRTFGVGADIQQGPTVLTNLGTRSTSMVAPGARGTGTYTYIIPAGWSAGTYTARAEVWTGTPGSTTLLNSYDRDFSVQNQVTSATITVAPIAAVIAGNSISVSYTVTNTGNYSRTFGVGAEILQGPTVLTNLGTRSTSTVAPGASAAGTYLYQVPAGWSIGTYTARAQVWTGTPGSSTLLNSYDRDFSVQDQITTATISVAPIAAVLAGNFISVNFTVTNTGNYSRTFGVGAEIRQGPTVLTNLGTRSTSTVAPGASAAGTYLYQVPAGWSIGTYTARAQVWTGTPGSSTLLNSYDRDFEVQDQVTSATITVAPIPTILPGNFISVGYTVTNTGNYSRTFGVGAEIRQGTTVLTNLGTRSTSMVVPGASATGTYLYQVPAGASYGLYTARAEVWTGTPGSTTFLNGFDRDFWVMPQPLLSNPRLAGTSFRVSSSTEAGFDYVLEFKNSPSDGNWTSVQTNNGTGGLVTLTNAGVVGPTRVYRVRVQ